MRVEFKPDKDFERYFTAQLSKLTKKVETKIADKVLKATANVYKQDLQQAIARDIKSSKKSGTRKLWSKANASKPWRGDNKSLTKKSSVRVYKGRSKGAKWAMVSQKQDYFYARVLEKGTDKHPLWRKKGSSNDKKIGTLPPRPVFMPTAEKSLPKMYRTFKSEFTKEIGKAILQMRRV